VPAFLELAIRLGGIQRPRNIARGEEINGEASASAGQRCGRAGTIERHVLFDDEPFAGAGLLFDEVGASNRHPGNRLPSALAHDP
jgi:hypothetical protein